ncbi:hypothetical protein [Mucilaginibacter paludis]|uniref:Uncharacterized protein n=1 Tax=Mucilaginibacter paludis DSM 18603 TaxID=714943 RepID=H1XZ76_9SPHI|nr:hypothetical protein [Mucilaginibacter paludis]EHQ24661.1 hypothetical protein Mucpa_0467 [Mucilaginibacter paludis DSM 18603]
MEDPKTYLILERLLNEGYNEENEADELELHKALRKTESIFLFRTICTALGNGGSLFGVPTLMAFAIETGPKAVAANKAIKAIKKRVSKDSVKELKDFFVPDYWKTVWVAPKEKFISFVVCLNGLMGNEDLFEGERLDELGEKLVKEIVIDLSPYHSFRELRLCTPEVNTEQDLEVVYYNFTNEVVLETAIAETTITINSDSQLDENIVNMQCDYLLTRLGLDIEDDHFRMILKAASVINQP